MARRKKLISLIKSVSLSQVETKKYHYTFDLFTQLPPAGSTQYTAMIPLYADLPMIKNTLTRTAETVIGEKIIAKGVKLKFLMVQNDTAVTAAATQVYRFTLISTANRNDASYIGNVISGPAPSAWFEPTTFPVTKQQFAMQRLKILKSKTVKIQPQGGVNFERTVNFWCPVMGTKTRKTEESLSLNDTFGQLKGLNYFVIVEVWNVNGEAVNTNTNFLIEKTSYFKDP